MNFSQTMLCQITPGERQSPRMETERCCQNFVIFAGCNKPTLQYVRPSNVHSFLWAYRGHRPVVFGTSGKWQDILQHHIEIMKGLGRSNLQEPVWSTVVQRRAVHPR